MSSKSNAQSNSDPWALSGNSNAAYPARHARTTKAAKHVPDAWDDDDDGAAEDDEEVDNAALWRDANSKQPMPEVVLTTSSTSSVPAPPPVALHQPMRILKRPSAPTSNSSTSVASTGSSGGGNDATSLRDREAAYHAARARIFGLEESGSTETRAGDSASAAGVSSSLPEIQDRLKVASLNTASQASSPLLTTSPPALVSVSRNPRGPPSTATTLSVHDNPGQDKGNSKQKGFTRRRGGDGGGKTQAGKS